MAPGRKKGANRMKKKRELSIGDLVLAKVKGFPAWPAKVSKPEDWDRTPDPKKHFVQFFGTDEIAFVAPADIQEFTCEAKNKLSARCQGKPVTDFSRAVKEICEAFEEQQNDSGKCDVDMARTDPCDTASTVDGLEIDVKDVEIDMQKASQDPDSEMHLLECSSPKLSGTGGGDVKPSVSCNAEHFSPVLSTKKCHEASDHGIAATKKDHNSSPFKEDVSGDRDADGNGVFPELNTVQDHSENLETGKNDASENGGNFPSDLVGAENAGSLVLGSSHTMQPGPPEKVVTNGQKSMEVDGIPKRIGDLTEEVHMTVKHIEVDGAAIFESGEPRKITRCSSAKESSPHSSKFTTADSSSRKKGKVPSKTSDRQGSDEHLLFDQSKKKHQVRDVKDKMATDDDSRPAKKTKRAPVVADSKKPISRRSPPTVAVESKQIKHVESKKSLSHVKVKNSPALKTEGSNAETNPPAEEVVSPIAKRRRQALEVTSDFVTVAAGDAKEKSSEQRKSKVLQSGFGKSPLGQLQSRRRAVCRFDDDDDEVCTTPIHGQSTNILKNPSSSVLDSVKDTVTYGSPSSEQKVKCTLSLDSAPEKYPNETLPSSPKKADDKRPTRTKIIHSSCSPSKLEVQRQISKEGQPALELQKASLELVTAAKPVEHKAIKPQSKAPGSALLKKAQTGSSKAEKLKTTPKSNLLLNDTSVTGRLPETESALGEGLEATSNDKTSSLMDPKFPDSITSMRHLIAAAQAKRREAQSQPASHDNHVSVSIPTVSVRRSMSPASALQSFPSGTSIAMPHDSTGFYAHTSVASPSVHAGQLTSQQVDKEEIEDGRVSSGYRAPVGSLSGGTEAAVARDAFEGMIETLSRTKDSIGRATRCAIDCAKYGIASEVVELLIRKLETESSFHRKVDLFFLVDSITQCSHSHKGIAGASYIPTVQAALPRLLGAAAPPGAGARENRRQCLKVLRLWLERKILPASVLRRYMDDIGSSNDDMSVTAGIFLRRPSRAERAIDDPIREMEGMLVDEYGSNATFELPGLLSSRILEDDEDLCGSLCKEAGDESPGAAVHASENPTAVTPSDRRHRILEDVDGELEMEDVSGSIKVERSIEGNDSFKSESHQCNPEQILGLDASNQAVVPFLPMGSPPLPLDSPPPLPPLPSSPPPPPQQASPPLPPPSSSPPLPPPPTSPPPPPPFPLQTPPPPLPLGPPPSLVPTYPSLLQPSLQPQLSLPPQQAIVPQQSLTCQPALQSSLTPLGYQPPVHQEYCMTPTGSQLLQLVGNTSHPGQVNTSFMKNENFPHPSPSLVSAGVCSTTDPSGFSSGNNEIYLTGRACQNNQQFQTGNASFAQRPYHPAPPPQTPPSFVSYPQPSVQNQMQQPYPHPFPVPSLSNDRRQYGVDEQWRMPSNDINSNNQHGGWAAGGRTASGSGAPFVHEGFLRQPVERPNNNMGFQISVHNPIQTGVPIQGHGVSHMPPCRPDISAHNCWRPA